MECEVISLAYTEMLAAGLLSFFGSGGPKSYILPHDMYTPEHQYLFAWHCRRGGIWGLEFLALS